MRIETAGAQPPMSYASQAPIKDASPVLGSVSIMRSIFESQHGDSFMQHDDDEMTTESLDVKSIRSIFEDSQEKPTKQESENSVTKIRSMFEQRSPRHNQRTKMAVRNLEMTLRKKPNSVRSLGKQSPATKAENLFPNRSSKVSLEGDGSTKIDSPAVKHTANNDEARADQDENSLKLHVVD